jgi:PBP1b-binding outer membrane lipoprotein LpoB
MKWTTVFALLALAVIITACSSPAEPNMPSNEEPANQEEITPAGQEPAEPISDEQPALDETDSLDDDLAELETLEEELNFDDLENLEGDLDEI